MALLSIDIHSIQNSCSVHKYFHVIFYFFFFLLKSLKFLFFKVEGKVILGISEDEWDTSLKLKDYLSLEIDEHHTINLSTFILY